MLLAYVVVAILFPYLTGESMKPLRGAAVSAVLFAIGAELLLPSLRGCYVDGDGDLEPTEPFGYSWAVVPTKDGSWREYSYAGYDVCVPEDAFGLAHGDTLWDKATSIKPYSPWFLEAEFDTDTFPVRRCFCLHYPY